MDDKKKVSKKTKAHTGYFDDEETALDVIRQYLKEKPEDVLPIKISRTVEDNRIAITSFEGDKITFWIIFRRILKKYKK